MAARRRRRTPAIAHVPLTINMTGRVGHTARIKVRPGQISAHCTCGAARRYFSRGIGWWYQLHEPDPDEEG
jgi:hypothetical protein